MRLVVDDQNIEHNYLRKTASAIARSSGRVTFMLQAVTGVMCTGSPHSSSRALSSVSSSARLPSFSMQEA